MEKDNMKNDSLAIGRSFITATQELIREKGIENLSVRKIALVAGYHNSTIYLHFENLNHLATVSSMDFFTEYSNSLAELTKSPSSPDELFFLVWKYFAQSAFALPNIFHNFFFGEYSDQIDRIMDEYYRYFPEKKEVFNNTAIENMYYGKNIKERCLSLLQTVPRTSTLINDSTIAIINDINVCCLKTLLDRKRLNLDSDVDEYVDQLLAMIRHTAGL